MPWYGETKTGVNPWYGGGYSAEIMEFIADPGASAGDVTVTGINVGDELIAVHFYVGSGTAVTDVTDITSEFTISAADTINNDTGTDSSGGNLRIIWRKSVENVD